MGHKVDMREVADLSNEVTLATKRVQSSLDAIQKSLNVFNSMDSFQGEAVIAAKNYFNNVHNTLIEAFHEVYTTLNDHLNRHIDLFHSYVDSGKTAKIASHYLQEHHRTVTDHYNAIKETSNGINRTLIKIADISGVSAPNSSGMSGHQSLVTQHIQQLDRKLDTSTSFGKRDHSNVQTMLHAIESLMTKIGKTSGSSRFTEHQMSSANPAIMTIRNIVINARRGKTGVEGVITSFAMYMAGKNAGLDTEEVPIGGKKYYRVIASREALERLGIKPDAAATKDLMYRLPKGDKKWKAKHHAIAASNRAVLKFGGPKGSGWSDTGKAVIRKYPEIAYYSKDASIATRAKIVGKASFKGAIGAFKDTVDFRGIARSGVVKGAAKSLAPIGAGLNYYANYHDAIDAGLQGKDAVKRATVDTAIDTAVGGAVQAGSVALFTAIIPIPGVGTAVGVLAGIGANWALNNFKYGKEKKSTMEHIKGWFH